MGNDICIWEMSQVFEKCLNYVGNDLDLYRMAQICGEITLIYDKRLKNVENDLEIWEMAKIFRKCLIYVGHSFNI